MKVELDNGQILELGETEATPTISIVDYSRREVDDFGVTTVVERDFARRMSVRLIVPFDQVDDLQRRLADLRATPVRWIADDRYSWLDFTGFYKDFEVDLAVPPVSYCTLTVEGLSDTEPFVDVGGDPSPLGSVSSLQLFGPKTVAGSALVSTSVAEDTNPEWSTGVTYQMGQRVSRAASHRVYESAIANNLNRDPTSADGTWLDVGPTNRWAMFDQAIGTSTVATSSLEVVVNVGAANAVALLDVVGTSVRVQAPGYDRTQPSSKGTVPFLDMPAGSGPVTVTVTGSGEVSVGTLLIGERVPLGSTVESPKAGITDFSRKEADEFGDIEVVERGWVKRMSVEAMIRTDALDLVAGRVAAARARPSLWIGESGIDSLTVYGFFKDFAIEVGTNVSKLSLSIEGFTALTENPTGASIFAGYIARLTNQSFSIAAAPDGTVASFANAGGQFVVQDTEGKTVPGVTFAVLSEIGVDVSIDPDTGVYTVHSMSADSGSALMRATVGSLPLDAVYSIAKSRAGQKGEDGEGTPGAAATSAYLTNDSVTLFAYANGHVVNYTPAAGAFKVFSGTTDVSGSFTLSTLSNPQSLTVVYTGQSYKVTGGVDDNEQTASVAIRATGSGAFADVVHDRLFTIAKVTGGYEIVGQLPTADNFEGRVVFQDGKLWRYTEGAFTSATDASDIVGLIEGAQIEPGAIDPSKFAPGTEPITNVTSIPAAKSTTTIYNTTDGKLYRWNGTAYEPAVTLPGLGYLGDLDATAGDNIVRNGAFKNGLTNWNVSGPGALVVASSGDPANFVRATGADARVFSTIYDIPAGATTLYFSYWKRSSQAGRQVAFYIEWLTATGAGIYLQSEDSFVGLSNTWTFVKGRFTPPAGAARFRVSPIATCSPGHTNDLTLIRLSVTEISATSGAPAGTVIGSTLAEVIESYANDPAARINAATTTINGGKITTGSVDAIQLAAESVIVGKVAAGAIITANLQASAVSADKLAVGLRNARSEGITFSIGPVGTVSWTPGILFWTDDAGAQITQPIAGGSCAITNGFVYISFAKQSYSASPKTLTALSGNNGPFLNSAANIPIAVYEGGYTISVLLGATMVDGRSISTGTITADQIGSGQILTSKLNVSAFDNLAMNADLATGTLDGWSRVRAANGSVVDVGSDAGWPTKYGLHFYRGPNDGTELSIVNGVQSFEDASMNSGIPMEPGDEIYIECINYTGATSSQELAIDAPFRWNANQVVLLDAFGIENMANNANFLFPTPGPSFKQSSGYFRNNTGQRGRAYFRFWGPATPNTHGFIWALKMRRRNAGKLIVEGGIVTQNLSAGAVSAAKIGVTQLSAITADVGLLRTATVGARMELESNQLRAFYGNGQLALRLGVW